MSEKSRREAAQSAIVDQDEEAREVPGRLIKQMVSVRLEAQLLKELRLLAAGRGVSVSDLLREAAINLIEDSRPAVVRLTTWSTDGPHPISKFGSSADFTGGTTIDSDQPSSGSAGIVTCIRLAS